MRNQSHKSLIAIIREHVIAWRTADDWSRESVVDAIVHAHEQLNGPAITGIRFDPQTRDTFQRMKVNADRVFRWLDDEGKDTNFLPANFIPSILAALPPDRRRHCMDDILRPLNLAVRTLAPIASDTVTVAQFSRVARESTEALTATAALLDGDASPDELLIAHRETCESIVASRDMRATIEGQMAKRGMAVPAIEEDPS